MISARLFALLLFGVSLSLQADDMRPASLSIQAINESQYNVVWRLPLKQGKAPELTVRFDSQTRDLTPAQSSVRQSTAIREWQIQRPGGLAGSEIHIEGLRGTNYQVLLRISNQQQQLLTTLLNTETPSYQLADANLVGQGTFITYLIYGVEHILIGLDHLLFVACLVYISRNRRRLFWAITGFTLAHSLTLMMAAMDLWRVPTAPVEAVIALSILFLAREIALYKTDSLSLKYPIMVSSSFGLLHGFGFAAVLAEIGLPSDEKLLALLSFNIGVEIGQLLFIALLFICFWLLVKLYRSLTLGALRLPISYLCGTVASFWMIERLLVF